MQEDYVDTMLLSESAETIWECVLQTNSSDLSQVFLNTENEQIRFNNLQKLNSYGWN